MDGMAHFSRYIPSEWRKGCSVSPSYVAFYMSSRLITNRMRFYFFQSKCVVIVSSACHLPRDAIRKYEKIVKSLRISWAIFDAYWDASDWWKSKILVAFSRVRYQEIFFDTLESFGRREFDIACPWLFLLAWSQLVIEDVLFCWS